ncbi:MAG: hypothetical protein JSS86_25455 [Cyanobacteria bacterium SZAS LIN-2]|nr:hypothetical protein [Cyanobacteria bacterium SZAS LIN-2]
MTAGEFNFLTAWLESALPSPRQQQASNCAVTLNESLLKALALVDQDKAAEADAVFKEALDQIRTSKNISFDVLPTIADLSFGYGRLLLKMKEHREGHALIDIALRLYTRLYGIEDGRTIFCADKKRELARTANNQTEIANVQYFLRAHNLLNRLKSLRLLPDAGPTDFNMPIEKSTDLFSADLRGMPVTSTDQQIDKVEDKHIVLLVVELFAACAEAEGHTSKLAIIPVQDMARDGYIEIFVKAITNPVLRKEVSETEKAKWSGVKIDELCGLVNKRLKQLRANEQFYILGRQSDEASCVYLFCSQDQVGRLKDLLPIGGNGKKP